MAELTNVIEERVKNEVESLNQNNNGRSKNDISRS